MTFSKHDALVCGGEGNGWGDTTGASHRSISVKPMFYLWTGNINLLCSKGAQQKYRVSHIPYSSWALEYVEQLKMGLWKKKLSIRQSGMYQLGESSRVESFLSAFKQIDRHGKSSNKVVLSSHRSSIMRLVWFQSWTCPSSQVSEPRRWPVRGRRRGGLDMLSAGWWSRHLTC